MSRPRLNVTTQSHGDATVIAIEGEIDLSTAPQLERELLDAAQAGSSLVVDLHGVDFMDSTGIGVLVRTSQKITEDDGTISLVCGEGPVRRVLKISGLEGIMPVYDDVAAAIA